MVYLTHEGWRRAAGRSRLAALAPGRLAALVLGLIIASANLRAVVAGTPEAAAAPPKPQRIVSLNLCTDQLVMLLAGEERIAALSHLARDPQISVQADRAATLPVTYGQAEEVFLLKPDLVVSGAFHLNATVDILRRLGIPVEEFAGARSFADIRVSIRRMGRLLGEAERAENLVAAFDLRLAELGGEAGRTSRLAALYYANSYTSGVDTLAAEVVAHAGFENLGSRLGLSGTAELPLETLVMGKPDLVVTGLSYDAPALAQEVFAHPALDYLESRSGRAVIPEKLWICGTPFTADAVAKLVEARRGLPTLTAGAANASIPTAAAAGAR